MLTLAVLGIFLSLYFFKYIPRQQYDHNRRAFLELEQIEKAIQSRNAGYSRAIAFIPDEKQSRKPRFTSLLSRSFKDSYVRRSSLFRKTTPEKTSMLFTINGLDDNYRMTYPLLPDSISSGFGHVSPGDSIHTLSIRLDSVLNPIFTTYRDIFENYLLIGKSSDSSQNRILFNPGGLSLDTWINTDSLLKKNDGVSIRNVRDVIIEGNPYKLFIYPFQLGEQQVILAGLISNDQYMEGYKDIPLDLLIPAGIVILLLLMNFPILKVFILGFYERITDIDIRMIIGSFFIAAFTGFFLFSWVYLMRVQDTENKANLQLLSRQVEDRFTEELRDIISQLKSWDTTYARQLRSDDPLLPGLKGWGRPDDGNTKDSAAPDSAFRPLIYPYADNAFWIDSSGKWLATFSEKKYNSRPILLQVSDRKYFKDFINKKFLKLDDPDSSTPFTIQPTLSRLDGEYTITVIIQSHAFRNADSSPDSSPAVAQRPHPLQLVGLSAKMLSVTNTILPHGYSFSVIDDNGQVLYDAKQGRALLSNIIKESDEPGKILECAHFRNQRYFPLFRLKGQKCALSAAPMKTLPYTILTYRSLSDADSSQLHLIGLSAFFAAFVLALLILSTIINEWTGKKPRMLQAPANHFEWLRPLPAKESYYRQMIKGMLSMLAVYVLAWFILRFLPRQWEFSLFFISLAMPFYSALYYYTIRERYKQAGQPFRLKALARPLMPVLLFLSIVVIIIISFSYTDTYSAKGIPWIALFIQLILLGVAGWFIYRFEPIQYAFTPSGPSGPSTPSDAPSNPASSSGSSSPIPAAIPPVFHTPLQYATVPAPRKETAWLRYYAGAIVTGVVLISIIPACGIFWLLSGQEASLQHNSERVETARAINARRLTLNERMTEYKSALADPGPLTSPDSPSLRLIKFRHGIYLLQGDSLTATLSSTIKPFLPVSSQYQDIHELFFPGDSSVLSSSTHPNSAEDGTWLFFISDSPSRKKVGLLYNAPQDWVDKGPLRLQAGPDASASALSIVGHQIRTTGPLFIFLYFGALLLAVFLAYKVTMALATRIFMIDLFRDTPCPPGEPSDNTLPSWLAAIRDAERKNKEEELVLCNRQLHKKFYAQLWSPLLPIEKFVLFDLSKDGFSNYRTAAILYQLRKKNLLVFYNGRLEPVTDSFREYVLDQAVDKDIVASLKKSRQNGSWQAFKLPLTILFTAFGLFIFFTQGALYQKLGGLFTSLISMGAQISSFFDKTGRQPTPDPEADAGTSGN